MPPLPARMSKSNWLAAPSWSDVAMFSFTFILIDSRYFLSFPPALRQFPPPAPGDCPALLCWDWLVAHIHELSANDSTGRRDCSEYRWEEKTTPLTRTLSARIREITPPLISPKHRRRSCRTARLCTKRRIYLRIHLFTSLFQSNLHIYQTRSLSIT